MAGGFIAPWITGDSLIQILLIVVGLGGLRLLYPEVGGGDDGTGHPPRLAHHSAMGYATIGSFVGGLLYLAVRTVVVERPPDAAMLLMMVSMAGMVGGALAML